jgi:hypothetical protein
MGLPKDNEEDYKNSSPTTFAANLKGDLLIVHGTGMTTFIISRPRCLSISSLQRTNLSR